MNTHENLMMGEQPSIPNYLWQSIAVTILCCWPLGIPAIIFAAKVNQLVASDQIEEAQQASAQARMWCWISFGLGLLTIIASVALQLLFFVGTVATY